MLKSSPKELKQNSYQVLRGSKLNKFKELLSGTVTDDGTKTAVMGVFNFRATIQHRYNCVLHSHQHKLITEMTNTSTQLVP